jgi:hypothetical protein
MPDSPAFELVSEALERDTSLDRLAARGTVRLALKAAGLDARSVAPAQMAVVATSVLPGELESRGVEDGDRLCGALVEKLSHLEAPAAGDTPDAVFARLGGR